MLVLAGAALVLCLCAVFAALPERPGRIVPEAGAAATAGTDGAGSALTEAEAPVRNEVEAPAWDGDETAAREEDEAAAREGDGPALAPTDDPSGLEARPAGERLPDAKAWHYRYNVFIDGRERQSSPEGGDVCLPDAGGYTALEGVVTFRGGNLRQNAAFGVAALEGTGFDVLWNNRIGSIDSGYARWTGVGWTGQPVIVRWPESLRLTMNLYDEFKRRDDFTEVIYGTLDGCVYFLDARSGAYSRRPINLGFPIKGSVSVDPRGYPLLYVGQGISKANGRTGSIGWRIYSLLDQRELYFLDGRDRHCFRDHGAFDGACVVDAATDTVFQGGENGMFYSIRLNSAFDPQAPGVSVRPQVTAYRYKSAVSTELGIENSVAACGHYAWFADNSGLLSCMDLNTLQPVWLFDTGDDTDATIALEREEGDRVALYTVNQVDKQGASGRCTVRRIDALTGEVDWSFSVACESDGDNGGGGFASPAVGDGAYGDYIYFNICRTEGGGRLYCFRKADGGLVWSRSTGTASWSSPVLAYREDGTGVLIVCNCGGRGVIRMFNPEDGKPLGKAALDGRIEGSPAVFEDLLVVGTRDCRIYGLRIR